VEGGRWKCISKNLFACRTVKGEFDPVYMTKVHRGILG
jgi:hypothetical protein